MVFLLKQDRKMLYKYVNDFISYELNSLEKKSDDLNKLIESSEDGKKKEKLKDTLTKIKKYKENIEAKIALLDEWNKSKWKYEIEQMNKQSLDARINSLNFTVFCSENLYCNGEGKPNSIILARIIEYYFPMVYYNNFYIYDKGLYIKVNDLIVNKIITSIMFVCMNNHIKNETMDRLKTFSAVNDNVFKEMFLTNDYKLINFKNCYIKFKVDKNGKMLSSFEVLKHSPDTYFNIQIPFDFDKNMLNEDLEHKTPAFNQYLATTFNDDVERNLFLEFSGSCFLHTNYVEKMVFARGNGGNGKGVWDRLLKQIFGKFYCNPDGNEMTDVEKRNQFFGLEFIDSYVGFSTEVHKNIKDLSFVKKLPGNDEINIQLKGVNDRLKFISPTKIIFSLNSTAKIYETEDAIKRRVIFLSMNNKIKRDTTLEPRMAKEIKYIFYRFFKSLLGLISRDCEFILPQSHYELAKICWESNNNFTNFIVNHIEYDESCKGISRKKVFDMMNHEFGGMYKKSIANFYNLLEDELKNNSIEVIMKKDRMDNYIIDDDEGIIINENSKVTSVTVGYKHLKYVDSKISYDENRRAVLYKMPDCKKIIINSNPILPLADYFYIENGEPIKIKNIADYLHEFGFTATLEDNTTSKYSEWCKEVDNADLDNKIKLNLRDKLEQIFYRSNKYDLFMAEYKKNPTIDKVEFLKTFDIECDQQSISK
jgi:phage/plasmid-associated DNA primase